MRIEKSFNRVEGLCTHGSWSSEQSVITFIKSDYLGNWTVGSSMCMPSNFKDALKVHKCMTLAFEAVLLELAQE